MSKTKSIPENWKSVQAGKAITRSFEFQDFNAAWAFMTHVALIAAKLDHHPDWKNSYNKVSITLTTHDAKGLSPKDIKLANAINDIVWLA